MTNKFPVEYPLKNDLGHTIEYYPNTKAGQKKAIQDLKYYKAKVHKLLDEKDKRIAELELNNTILEHDYMAAIEMIKYK